MAIRDSGGISAGDIAKVASAQGTISLDISGDVKQSMLDFISVANRMVSGSKLGQYFGTTEQLAKRLANAVRLCNEDFKQFRGFDSANAKEVVNTFNALTASANGADVSSFFKGVEGGFRGVMSTVEAVQAKIGKFTEGFSEADFSRMFGSFQQIKDWANTLGLGTKEVENLMSSLSQLSGTDVSALTQQLSNAEREITYLKEQLNSATSGRMFKELQAELEEVQSRLRGAESMLEEMRDKAMYEFRNFLSVNMIDPDQYNEWGSTRFQDYFDRIQQGTMSAGEAITRFKTEYESLFQNVDSERGLFNVAQVEEFTAKLDQIFVRVEEIGTYIQNTTANAPGMLTNAVERDLQNINKEEQALRHVIDEGGQLGQVGQIVNGVAEASASGTQKMGEMSEQTVKLVDSLTALGSAGEESLTAISAIFRHIGTIKDLDVNTDQFKKLKEALEILQGTTGLEKIGMLSNVNLQGFSNLKISTTIGHLATYLPPLSRDVDISKLQALSQINLSNFSQDNLKVSKASMDHLRELIAQISGKPTQIVNNGQTQQLTEEQTAVERLNTTYREHSEAVAHAIADEQQKAIISTELTAKLQSEKEAMDAVSGSAERGASSGQKYSAVWDKMFLGKFVAEFAKVKAQFDALEDKPAKLADNMRKLEAAENDMRAATNMKDRVDAYERFVTILDVVRTQIGAVNAEAKNSNADFKGLLNMVKQASSAMDGIANSSFTSKLREMSAKMKDVVDPTAVSQLKEMRKAYVDMQAAYGTTGPNTEQDYQALINAQIRWRNALEGLNRALAANRAESAAANQANRESAQTAKAIADGAAAAETQIKNLNAVFESLRDKTKFDTSSFEQMRTLLEQVNNTSLSNDQRQSALQQLNDLIKQNTENLRELSAAEKAEATAKKQTDNAAKQKATLIKQLNSLLDQCTKAEQRYAIVARAAFAKDSYKGIQDTKASVQQLLQQLNGVDPKFAEISAGVRQAQANFSTFNTTLKNGGGILGDYLSTGMAQLKSRLTYTFGLAAMVYKTVGEIKKMISTAVELDSAMNTLQIVTRASGADMDEYGKRVSSMAKETAQATKDLIDATTVYARLGYSMDESTTLARYTAMLQNVGGIEASAAQDAMTAIIKAFGKNVDDIEDVMDKLVLVGNRFPISVSQLAEGMNNAGSMLNVAGNSFEQSIALLTAANSTIQNISKASTGLRTIAARIRKTTTGEDDEGEIVEESKYQEMVNALTKKHVDLVDKVTGEYRSTYDIIRDIARVWKDMTSMEQAAVVEALAGTRQQNIFASLMTQFGAAEDAMEQMEGSAGALQQSYDIYLNSIQAHIQTFKAAFDELSKTVVDSDFAKGVIDIGTVIIETIEKLVDNLGVLGTAVTVLGSTALLRALRSGAFVASIKGVGQAVIGVLGTIKAVAPELLLIAGAIAAVTFAVKKYKEAHPTVDDLSAAAAAAKTEAEAAKKAYEDTADAIKENKKRIKELQVPATNGEITAAQKTELEKLIEQNTEYERQIELLKRKAELTKEAADDSQRETAHAKLQEYVGDGTKRNVTYFGAGAWDRVGGDAKVVLGGTVPEHNDATYNINAAIQMYAYAQEQLRAIQHEMDRYVDEDTDAAREKAAKLLADEAAAKQTVSDTYAQLRSFYIDLANLRDEFSGLTDPQSVDDLRYLDYWLEQLDKAMKKDDAEVEKFKRNLEYLDKTVRDKLTKGLRLNEEEQKRFYDWLNRCGYKAEDFGRILQKMQQDAEGIELPGGEESDEDTFVDHQLVKWGTLADEIETAKAALEEYNKALEGGNNGDTAAAMQDAWQKAMEEIDEGRVDSRAAWALYEMVFSPEQIDAMGRDANRLAQAIGSEFLRGLFDDSNSENGYDDSDSVYGYGQRLIYKLMDNLDQLEGIDIWRDDTGLHYWIDDFKALADQLGISEGLLDAFLDDLDAYGAEMLIDTKQNTALTNSLNDYLNNIDDAREATKKFVEDTLNDPKYKDVDDTTVLRILDSLHAQGDLQLDPAIYRSIVDDVRAAMKQAAEEAAAEDGALKIEAEPDEEYAQNGMITLLGNMQDFLNQEENELKINVGYNIADFPDLSVDYGDSGSGSSSNEGYASASGKKAGKNGGDTLVNELGPELISDNGRAFIANGGKPGFVRLSDDAIVFTANETKDILKGKRNVNAKAYATGTVRRGNLINRLVRGSVQARAYIRCPVCGTANPDSRSTCYSCGASLYGGSVATVNNSIGTTGNANAGVNRSAYGSPTAMPYQNMGGTGYDIYGYDSYDQQAYEAYVQAQYYMEEQRLLLEAARKREEEARRRAAIDERNRRIQAMRENQKKNSNRSSFAGTGGGNYVGGADYASAADPQKVDWVAIRINRIQRAIADLEKVASSGFKKLDTRLRAARDQIAKTTDEIEVMERAYDRYIQEANSVGLSESIAANVREGTIDINSYDDDTRKKIDEYQEW